MLGAGLAGCGGPTIPSQASLAAKLATAAGGATLTADQRTCLAGVLREYGSAASLRAYVAGSIPVSRVQGVVSTAAKNKIAACVRR